MACGDGELLREALARLAQLEAGIPEATPLRLLPVIGLQGNLAWLEGRGDEAQALWAQALANEEACDLFGLAHELRTRLALQCLQGGDASAAAAWLRPMLAQASDGPRGALFALPALRELAAAAWGSLLGRAEQAVLRAWSAVAAAPPVATVEAPAGRPGSTLQDPLSAREAEVLALMARGLSNKHIARELGAQSAHGEAPRRAHPRKARPRVAKPGGGLVPRAIGRLRRRLTRRHGERRRDRVKDLKHLSTTAARLGGQAG